MQRYKKFLSIITVALLVANLLVYGIFGDDVSRTMRFISMVVFFVIFLNPAYYKKNALLIFVAFVLNDFLLIFYETLINQNLVLFIRLCAYLLLARLVFPYLRKIKIHIFDKILFTGILIINWFLLYNIKDTIGSGQNASWLEDVLIYAYGTSLIIAVATAFSFYSRYIDKASIFFLLSIIGLLMSDLTFFVGFYLDFPEFYYLDRGFNIVSLGFLLHFLLLFKNKIARGFYNGENDVI
ncbi:hypothetical protein [Salinimicrobium sp. TH3]|uniref:hypothetical protein n=1 Tax=Salinimicrobium sp. TH3 TaxID=2997342 RepID=UPI002276EFE5|nr:hypothetical protein [Salinimicrobium sp. TH3]MCY2688472.1 hypothetical protein [Salinimicrobium sp. TH3]